MEMKGFTSFILALVDGNRTKFPDYLVAQGDASLAATNLRTSIETQLRSKVTGWGNTAVWITVFADLERLATNSQQAGLPIREFARHLNNAHDLTRFRDIGRSDDSHLKLEEMVKKNLRDIRCLSVVFVGPSWQGFDRFEERLAGDGQKVLLSKTMTISLPWSLRKIGGSSTEINIHNPSNDGQYSPTIRRRNHGVTIGGVLLRYMRPIYSPCIEDIGLMSCEENGYESKKIVPRNRAGQRIDPPIGDFSRERKAEIGTEEWCSNHHLKGHCPVKGCRFFHSALDEEGMNALRSLARGSHCRNLNECDDPDCYAGHDCPYNPCEKGSTCNFPQSMHIQDRWIVNIEGIVQHKVSQRRPPRGQNERKVKVNWRG